MLELEGISKRYGEKRVLDHISFTVKKGEAIGLLGPNGAGKSTLINIIVGNIRPSSGKITLLGAQGMKLTKARMQLGYVPQELAIYEDLKVWENIELIGALYGLKKEALKEAIEEMLTVCDLLQEKDTLVKKLSAGMKRRLNMACALVHHPEFLIFDEPTVAIDPQSRRFILEKIKKLNEAGRTILYTSHYMEEVEYLCQRIAIVDHGRLIAMGTKAELVALVGDDDEDSLSLEEVFVRLTGKEFHV